MSVWKKFIASLALMVGLSPAVVFAQGIGAGAGAAGAAPGAATGAAGAAGGAVDNIWSKICPTPEQKEAFKAKICAKPLGQLLNNMLKPAGALTGGILGPFCPEVTAEDLAKPPTSAEGAAAQAKADALAAKERAAAVRYLGTLDCRYWPEAEVALINALRADRFECVRLEAAIALNRGCCCTKNIIKALALTVSGATDDGNPSECSPRVKAVARTALERCLSCYVEVTPVPEPEKKDGPKGNGGEKPKGEVPEGEKTEGEDGKKKNGNGQPMTASEARLQRSMAFYRANASESKAVVVGHARQALGTIRPVAMNSVQPQSRERSLMGVIRQAMSDTPGRPVQQRPRSVVGPRQLIQQKAGPKLGTPATRTAKGILPITPMRRAPRVVQQPRRTAPRTGTVPTSPMNVPQPTKWSRSPQRTPAVAPKTSTSAKPVAPVTYQQKPQTRTQSKPPSMQQLMTMLTASSDPRHRTWAAHMLSAYDGASNPQIVQVLVGSAHRDDSPSTRIACLRSLVRLNVRSNAVLTVVKGLQSDPNVSVRQEAQRAYQALSGTRVSALSR